MSEAIRFENEDEARAWDRYAAAAMSAFSNDNTPANHAANLAANDADALLLERRKRTAPQATQAVREVWAPTCNGAMRRGGPFVEHAPGVYCPAHPETTQGEDGLPEGWASVADSSSADEDFVRAGSEYTVTRWGSEKVWRVYRGDDPAHPHEHPTRAAAIAAVEAHLRGKP